MRQKAETAIHLAKACRTVIPELYGESVSPPTAARWANKGLRAADGSTVKLKAFRAGRHLVTSREWLEQFFEELARRNNVCATTERARLIAHGEALYGSCGSRTTAGQRRNAEGLIQGPRTIQGKDET